MTKDARPIRIDVVLVLVLFAVVLGGFWMTGFGLAEKMESINQRLDLIDVRAKQSLDRVIELQNASRELRRTCGAAAATARPASPAPVAPAARK